MADRPRGREKNVGGSGSVFKQGSGLGLGGPAGKSGRGGAGLTGRPLGTGSSSGGGSAGGPVRRSGGRSGCGIGVIAVIVVLFLLLRSCGSIAGSLLGGGSDLGGAAGSGTTGAGSGSSSGYASSGSVSGYDLSDLFTFGNSGGYSGYSSGGYGYGGAGYGSSGAGNTGYGGSGSSTATLASGSISNNNGVLNTNVSPAARSKYTQLKGNGRDTVTVMVYMCGADLESSYGMGTSDLKEMTQANFGDNLNLIVCTGGARKWQNNIVSNSVSEIYRVKTGGLERLENNFARQSMTDPELLGAFIQYASKNYPADRYDLIFWDHGSGTSGGYGDDEKYATSGSMSLDEIDFALQSGGIRFDFIGFDACLMATLENALMLSDYADYLIASEETEPGTGWYYTNWLGTLSSNTAVFTPELGKVIADDFLAASQRAGQGNEVTLSVTDLSELGMTVPDAFSAFSKAAVELLDGDEYSTVSNARSKAKEFARSNKLDQVDISDFAYKIGNTEGQQLADAIKAAVKYNRTSKSYGDAHGLSIYFPYRKVSYLDKVVSLYQKLKIDTDYTNCVKKFANLEVSGQAAGGGTYNPYSSLFGGSGSYGGAGGSGYGSSGYSSGYGSSGSGLSGYGSSGSSSGYGSSGSYSISGLEDLLGSYGGLFGSGGLSGSGGSSYGGNSYGGGLSGLGGSSYGSGSSVSGSDIAGLLLQSLLSSGSYGRVRGLNDDTADFLDEGEITRAAEYIAAHHLNTDHLYWTANRAGQRVLALDETDWSYVQDAELSVLYDDGEGYIDLGLDAVLEYDDEDNLLGEYDHTWLALNDHPIAYYHMETLDDGENYAISGYSPVLVNGQLADLLISFDNADPYGRIEGVRLKYADADDTGSEAAPVAKVAALEDGDVLQFVCDYYTYDGEFIDNYQLGDSLTVDGGLELRNVDIGERANASYYITDIYNQGYWTPIIE